MVRAALIYGRVTVMAQHWPFQLQQALFHLSSGHHSHYSVNSARVCPPASHMLCLWRNTDQCPPSQLISPAVIGGYYVNESRLKP